MALLMRRSSASFWQNPSISSAFVRMMSGAAGGDKGRSEGDSVKRIH